MNKVFGSFVTEDADLYVNKREIVKAILVIDSIEDGKGIEYHITLVLKGGERLKGVPMRHESIGHAGDRLVSWLALPEDYIPALATSIEDYTSSH